MEDCVCLYEIEKVREGLKEKLKEFPQKKVDSRFSFDLSELFRRRT